MKDIPTGTYKVKVQFIKDVHGNTGQLRALNDRGYGLVARAINAISSYTSKNETGDQCGRNVKSYRQQSIVLVVPAQ